MREHAWYEHGASIAALSLPPTQYDRKKRCGAGWVAVVATMDVLEAPLLPHARTWRREMGGGIDHA